MIPLLFSGYLVNGAPIGSQKHKFVHDRFIALTNMDSALGYLIFRPEDGSGTFDRFEKWYLNTTPDEELDTIEKFDAHIAAHGGYMIFDSLEAHARNGFNWLLRYVDRQLNPGS